MTKEMHIVFDSLLNRRQFLRASLAGALLDVSIPGVGLDKLRRTALNLGYGGVGYYPGAGFVHLDSGNFRTW